MRNVISLTVFPSPALPYPTCIGCPALPYLAFPLPARPGGGAPGPAVPGFSAACPARRRSAGRCRTWLLRCPPARRRSALPCRTWLLRCPWPAGGAPGAARYGLIFRGRRRILTPLNKKISFLILKKICLSCVKKMVAILFCARDSLYKSFHNADVFDLERNALSFSFNMPVVAHPPCRLWSRMRKFSNAPESEKELAFFALKAVRKCGGVLEHPYKSSFWSAAELPLGNEIDSFGGFTLDVDQFWWGHRCKKRTWLYVSGVDRKQVPGYPIRLDAVTHKVGGSKTKGSGLVEVSKKERILTPYNFCDWLINLASLCDNKKISK